MGEGRETFVEFLFTIQGKDTILGVLGCPRAAVTSPEMDFSDACSRNAL